MANYVRTRIVVPDAPGFERYLSHIGFDFNKVIPEPEDVIDRDIWRSVKWGTSDNALRSTLRYAHGVWDVSFGTSWAAPIPVFEALVKALPGSAIRFWCLDDERTLAIDGYANNNKLELDYLDLDSPGVVTMHAQRVFGRG